MRDRVAATAVARTGSAVAAHLRRLGPVAGLLDAHLGYVVEQTEAAAGDLVARVTELDHAVGGVTEEMAGLQGDAERSLAGVSAQVGSADALLTRIRQEGAQRDAAVLDLLGELQAMGRASDEMGEIARALKILSINARIEAARAGHRGGTIAVVADAVRDLATQSEGQAQSLGNDLSTLRERIVELLQASMDTVAMQLEQLGEELRSVTSSQQDLGTMVTAVVDGVAGDARTLGDIATQVLAATQFQDITRQVVEQVRDGLGAIGGQIGMAAGCLEGTGSPADLDGELLDGLHHAYVMAAQRHTHATVLAAEGAAGVGPVPAAVATDDGPAIELF